MMCLAKDKNLPPEDGQQLEELDCPEEETQDSESVEEQFAEIAADSAVPDETIEPQKREGEPAQIKDLFVEPETEDTGQSRGDGEPPPGTSRDGPAQDEKPPGPSRAGLLFQKAVGRLKQWYFIRMNLLYRYFYFVGVQFLRSTRTRRRHFSQRFRRMETAAAHWARVSKRKVVLWVRGGWRDLTAPLREMRTRCHDFRMELRGARKYGSFGKVVQACTRFLRYFLVKICRAFRFLLNYMLPVAGCIALFVTINYFSNLTLALKVVYNGEEVGYITDESVFTQAENAMKERMILGDVLVTDPTEDTYDDAQFIADAGSEEDESEQAKAREEQERAREAEKQRQEVVIIPRFELTVLTAPDKLTDVDDLTDELIRAAGKNSDDPNSVSIEEADGLYIEDEYVGAVTDGTRLLFEMDNMLNRYREPDMSDNAVIQFVKKVQVKRGLYPASSIRPLKDILTLLGKEERGKKIYTVVSGDDPLKIAAKNGITFDELKKLNPDVDIRLFPGDELLISQSVPYLGVQVTETVKYEEVMDYQIKQEVDPDMDIGYTRVKQEGKEGLREVTAEIKMIDGIEVERNIIDRTVIEQPVERILIVGGNQPLKFLPKSSSGDIPSGAFIWPADGGYVSCGFLGYYGHTGTDIAGRIGMGVRASAAGVVVVAKYSAYGYGNYIIIDHGAGVQTLYAHNSKLLVSVGQQVEQGELIALMGRTGNASGPHVHFEVRVNGQYKNAMNYLS